MSLLLTDLQDLFMNGYLRAAQVFSLATQGVFSHVPCSSCCNVHASFCLKGQAHHAQCPDHHAAPVLDSPAPKCLHPLSQLCDISMSPLLSAQYLKLCNQCNSCLQGHAETQTGIGSKPRLRLQQPVFDVAALSSLDDTDVLPSCLFIQSSTQDEVHKCSAGCHAGTSTLGLLS